jgi:hypothetical protein
MAAIVAAIGMGWALWLGLRRMRRAEALDRAAPPQAAGGEG